MIEQTFNEGFARFVERGSDILACRMMPGWGVANVASAWDDHVIISQRPKGKTDNLFLDTTP